MSIQTGSSKNKVASSHDRQNTYSEVMSTDSEQTDNNVEIDAFVDAKETLDNEPDSPQLDIKSKMNTTISCHQSIASKCFTTDLQLHEAIFKNDPQTVYSLLRNKEIAKHLVNRRDKHGNTPLHLACMLGRSKEIVSALLESGASFNIKNLNRWTPFHEACSYGNREILTLLTKRLDDDVHDAFNKAKLSEVLEKTKNYRMVLRWEFQSWLPFVSKVLPSDVCVITKQNNCLRIDTKLLHYSMGKMGEDCSLVYSSRFRNKWFLMNNKTRKFHRIDDYLKKHISTADIDDKVDQFMQTDILDVEFKSSDIICSRSVSGWIWKADKIETVGPYEAALYHFHNVYSITKKRREHLKDEDVKKNKTTYKAMIFALRNGHYPSNSELNPSNDKNTVTEDEHSDDHSPVMHRETLPPPPPPRVSWDDYCSSQPAEHPALGRSQKCKVIKRTFKASVAMSEDFPLSKDELVDLLSVCPLKLFNQLKEFIEMKLPPGFPVRVDIPILSLVNARITFQDFTFLEEPLDIDIPRDYQEDPEVVRKALGMSSMLA